MDSKTEPASEAKGICSARTEAKECEYYNDIESVAYECICGNVEINSRKYIPDDKANLLKQEITRLKAELERERELVSTREAQQDVMAVDTVRLLDQIEYQNKQAKVDYDKIKKLEFELERERELRKELVETFNNVIIYFKRIGGSWSADQICTKLELLKANENIKKSTL